MKSTHINCKECLCKTEVLHREIVEILHCPACGHEIEYNETEEYL